MRYGCCVNMVSMSDPPVGDELIPLMAACGYDYVELPLSGYMALSARRKREIRAALLKNGITCDAVSVFYPAGMALTGPDVDKRAVNDYRRRAIDEGLSLGARVFVFGSGGARTVPKGYPMQSALEQLRDAVRDMAAAQGGGAIIALEPLCRAECNILNTYGECCEVVRLADHPSARALADSYHMEMEGEEPARIYEGRELLGHVHIAAGKRRVFPQDPAPESLAQFTRSVLRSGYDGRVSIEAFSDDLEADAPKGLRFLRNVFR